MLKFASTVYGVVKLALLAKKMLGSTANKSRMSHGHMNQNTYYNPRNRSKSSVGSILSTIKRML